MGVVQRKILMVSFLMLMSLMAEIPSFAGSSQTYVYLSDMQWRTGWGFSGNWDYTFLGGVSKDVDAFGWPRGELALNGVVYPKGISACSYSEIHYDLRQQYTRFTSDIGLETGGRGVFKVYCDGKLAFKSDTLTYAMDANKIDISVVGVGELKLVLIDADNGSIQKFIMGDWAGARLTPGTPQTFDTQNTKILFVGNSLCPQNLLDPIMHFANSSGYKHAWETASGYHDQIIEQWTAGTDTLSPRGRIENKPYTHCVFQPNSNEYLQDLYGSNKLDTCKKYLKLFCDLAKQHNVKPYLYEYWVKSYFTDWESEIITLENSFKSMADYCGSDVPIIPCGTADMNIKRATLNGQITDFNFKNFYSFWTDNSGVVQSDNLHMSLFGMYINAMVHFSTIYQQSPEGLPTYNQIFNTPFTIEPTQASVSDASILKIQNIIWNTVKKFSYARIDTTILPTAKITCNKTIASIDSIINFDASGSLPASGSSIVKYRWTFGDNISSAIYGKSASGINEVDFGHVMACIETTSPTISHTYINAGTYFVRLVVIQADGHSSSSYLVVTVPPKFIDLVAPTTPTNLMSFNISNINFNLSWTSSNDNIGVVGYKVYKDGELYGITKDTTITISQLKWSTNYQMTVRAIDAAGNMSDESKPLLVSTVVTSLDETSSTISIYPNPVSDYLTISGISLPSHVTIFNMDGIVKLEQDVLDSEVQINVNTFSVGIYILKISNNKSSVIERFIKK